MVLIFFNLKDLLKFLKTHGIGCCSLYLYSTFVFWNKSSLGILVIQYEYKNYEYTVQLQDTLFYKYISYTNYTLYSKLFMESK